MPLRSNKPKPYRKEAPVFFDIRPLYLAMAWYGLMGEGPQAKARGYVEQYKEYHRLVKQSVVTETR